MDDDPVSGYFIHTRYVERTASRRMFCRLAGSYAYTHKPPARLTIRVKRGVMLPGLYSVITSTTSDYVMPRALVAPTSSTMRSSTLGVFSEKALRCFLTGFWVGSSGTHFSTPFVLVSAVVLGRLACSSHR